jgi:TolB protein
MDADGKNLTEIVKTGNPFGWVYPAWSPDGKRIAFSHPVGDASEIHVCDPDGGNLTQLTKLAGRNSYAAWSPDGKQIAFQHHENGAAGEVFVMDADGKNAKKLSEKAEAPQEGGRPAWRPK